MEYEIKILGAKETLARCYRNFVAAADSLRDRHYSFNTYYLDDARESFYQAGFSLRHRVGQLEIEVEPGTEIKALEGERAGLSARIEEIQNGKDALANYFKLMASDRYPHNAPRIAPNSLQINFGTAVRRAERRTLVQLCGKPWVIEAALDDIAYLRNEGQTGRGLYDAVLFPCGAEDELELELKPIAKGTKVTDQVLGQFMAWAAGNVVMENAGQVQKTTVSKAIRARQAALEI